MKSLYFMFHPSVTNKSTEAMQLAAEVLAKQAISGATIEKISGLVTFYRLSDSGNAENS